jgi:hypothetical protein
MQGWHCDILMLYKRASLACAEEANMQKEDAPAIALAGVFMMTVGTLMAYIAYACLNNEFPVVTYMFRDWPLVSSSTAGIGTTILLYGMTLLLSERRNIYMLLSNCSLWLVIGSSNYFGNDIIGWFHGIFTLLFLLFGTLSLARVLGTFRSWKVYLSFMWSISAVVSGFVLNVDRSLANARIVLGVSELLFIVTLGFGYFQFIIGRFGCQQQNQKDANSSVVVHLFKI